MADASRPPFPAPALAPAPATGGADPHVEARRPGPALPASGGVATGAAEAPAPDRGPRDAGARDSVQPALLAQAALLYYREGLTQADIARRLGLSRATVVSYLRQAREQGIVDIRIAGQSFAASPLAREVAARWGLRDVYVAHGEDAGLAARVAGLGAGALHDLLRPGDRLGVVWGETVQRLASAFPQRRVPGLCVYQLIGATNAAFRFGGETTAIEIARRCGAACRTLHAPAVVSSAALAAALRAEPIIASQLQEFAALDRAVFSVGDTGAGTTLVASGVAGQEVLAAHVARGAAAVLAGRFLDAEGRAMDSDLPARLIGISLEALRAVPCRMLVACGAGKVPAVAAALRGGFATHLVVDEAAARGLLEA